MNQEKILHQKIISSLIWTIILPLKLGLRVALPSGSHHAILRTPATSNIPKCKFDHEATCSKTFNVSVTYG